MIVYLNGKYLDVRSAKISVLDSGFLYGDGIFETLRTYNKKLWQLPEHLKRLRESAKMRGWKLPWSDKKLSEILEKTLRKNNFRESRVRITITPGAHEASTLFIWVQPLENFPRTAPFCGAKWCTARGISAITFPLERPFPRMKTTSMQPLLIARAEMAKKRAHEALLINRKGNITEGTTTNVFIVKRKIIITPRLGVLLGITRGTVLKLARRLFRIRQRDITLRELMNADEVFLTNAPKGIIPVIKVDEEKIGKGKPGPITKHLQELFRKKEKSEPSR